MPGAPCSLTRDPNRGNAVVEVHNCFFNQGEVKTDGLDLTLRTNFDLGAGGKLTNVLQASWSHEFTIDGGVDQSGRSEERRVWQEGGNTCRSRWAPAH